MLAEDSDVNMCCTKTPNKSRTLSMPFNNIVHFGPKATKLHTSILTKAHIWHILNIFHTLILYQYIPLLLKCNFPVSIYPNLTPFHTQLECHLSTEPCFLLVGLMDLSFPNSLCIQGLAPFRYLPHSAGHCC